MSRIKECFPSRWGDDGVIVEADFSQLEVIALAHLSQDVNLIADITGGVDMHCMSASFLYNTPYEVIRKAYLAGDSEWTKKRKKSKGPSFQLQYGAGVKSIAETNDLTRKQAKTFVSNYYTRYYGVKEFQERVADEVRRNRKPSNRRTVKGMPAGQGWYAGPTGRRWVFHEMDNPFEEGSTNFSPTQLKNYPVQGFATGDIVPLILGHLYRVLKNSFYADKALLINTVHDSIILDVRREMLNEVCLLVKNSMEEAPALLDREFGIKFDLPLPVGVSYGPTWAEQTEWSA